MRPLGKGGMAEVYEVEHVRLGVRRALKLFTAEGARADFLRTRFIAEGKLLSSPRGSCWNASIIRAS